MYDPETLLKTETYSEMVFRNIVGALAYLLVLSSFAIIGCVMGGIFD